MAMLAMVRRWDSAQRRAGTGRDDIFVLILHYFLPKRIFFFCVSVTCLRDVIVPAKEFRNSLWFWFLGLLKYVRSIQVKEMLLILIDWDDWIASMIDD